MTRQYFSDCVNQLHATFIQLNGTGADSHQSRNPFYINVALTLQLSGPMTDSIEGPIDTLLCTM